MEKYNAFEDNDLVIPDYYEELNLSRNSTRKELQDALNKMITESKTPKEKYKYELAMIYLVQNKSKYDKYLDRRRNEKKKKIFKVIRNAIIAGTMIAIGITGINAYVSKKEKENLNSNVCVEYEIEAGDTRNELEDKYGLKDISFEYYEISGSERQQAAGGDTSRFLAAGDVIIARTTYENAEKLVSEKGAKIISKEEALSMLEESGLNSYAGVFSDALNGDDTFVFYEPTNEKTLG